MPQLKIADVERVIFSISSRSLLLMRIDNHLAPVEFYCQQHFAVTGVDGIFTLRPLGAFAADRTTLKVTESRRRIPKIRTMPLVDPTGVVSMREIRRFPGFTAIIPTHIEVDTSQVNRIYCPE
ncbi:MAG: hypothetical protein PVI21_06130 [Candidatus Woesebacteria bacterium]|jgi:hypothetical protein